MTRRVLIATLCGLQLIGCAGDIAAPDCVRFSRHGGYCLQAADDSPAAELQQEVVAIHEGVRQSSLAQIAIAPQRMRVVAMTPFGVPLLDLTYADGTLSVARVPDARLDPALLLALVQFATLPEATLRRGLRGALELIEAPQRRELRDAEGLVLSMERAVAGQVYDSLRIPALRLEIEIRNLVTETE